MMDIKSPIGEGRNTYTYAADGRKLKVIQQWNSNYSTSPVIGSAITVSALNQTKTTEYAGNMIYENGALKRILIDGGYIEGGVYYYYLRDHLGNNRVVANASGTVIQRNHYYPFGMAFAETSSTEQGLQPYKYNDKELDRMHGLNLYDYEARYMDPALGRFTTMDPLAEKYYSMSPYGYCGGNPMSAIDLHGDSIWFSYQRNDRGILTGATMNVTGKVINISSNSGVNMTDAAEEISNQITSSFKGTTNGVTFSANVNLSVANSMDDVADDDHVFALADIDDSSLRAGQSIHGVGSSFGGKVAFVDADYFTGIWDTNIGNLGPGIAAHEFGHLAGLEHTTTGLMQYEPGGILRMHSTKISSEQLIQINNKYQTGKLNQGRNWEYQKIMSPAAGGYISKKMPYRGAANRYVTY